MDSNGLEAGERAKMDLTFSQFCEQCCDRCRIIRWLGVLNSPKDELLVSTYPKQVGPRSRYPPAECLLCVQLQEVRSRREGSGVSELWLPSPIDPQSSHSSLHIKFHDYYEPFIFEELQSSKRPNIQRQYVDPMLVDYANLRMWLERCRSRHGILCGITSSISMPQFRVIDCNTTQIVPLPDSTQYAALSYVWGKERVKSCGYPQTIKDSIVVTQAMGLRYLWIDRYCIDQNDEQHRHDQIKAMADIYLHADFTIIATVGDAYHGLPGINSHSRTAQTVLYLGDRVFSTTGRLSTSVTTSTWANRAWTYQGGAFSRRRVFFTEHGVVFWCSRLYCEEDKCRLLADSSALEFDIAPIAGDGFFSVPTLRTESKKLSTRRIVCAISTREMTHEEDALNVCLGTLNALESTHFWGIPVLRNQPSACIDEEDPDGTILSQKEVVEIAEPATSHYQMDLSWYTVDLYMDAKRNERKGFPTWSWTRWSGSKRFCTSSYYGDDSGRRVPSSILAIEIQLQDATWVNILQINSPRGNLGDISSGKKLKITGNILRPRLHISSRWVNMTVATVYGTGFEVSFGLDSHNPKEWFGTLGEPNDVVALEFERLQVHHDDSATSVKRQKFIRGIYLLLIKQSDSYRRIGIADVFEICDDQEWPTGPIPIHDMEVCTLYLE